MNRTNLFFKVVVEHDEQDLPERLGAEIARKIERTYGVRSVELTNHTRSEE